MTPAGSTSLRSWRSSSARVMLFECGFDTAIQVDVYFTSALEN